MSGDGLEGLQADLSSHRIEGYTTHGHTHVSLPLVSHIETNLWMGGCRDFVQLPDSFVHVVSLYQEERYWLGPITTRRDFSMEDATWVDEATVDEAVTYAIECLADGPTLIHCQAGLNRSGLVTAGVLMAKGFDAQEAIELLRERRGDAVLCNPAFERWLLER